LRHREIWCGNLSALNDPLEGKLNFNEFDGKRDLSKMDKMNQEIGLASFSEDWRNLAMWAHYASQGQGICIAYNYASLMSGLPENSEFLRVSYNREVPSITADMKPETYSNIALSNKLDCWSYEREWRLISQKSGSVGYAGKRIVHGVYLGPNFNNEWIGDTKLKDINGPYALYKVKVALDGKITADRLVTIKGE
jgi:hypothetical protein